MIRIRYKVCPVCGARIPAPRHKFCSHSCAVVASGGDIERETYLAGMIPAESLARNDARQLASHTWAGGDQ